MRVASDATATIQEKLQPRQSCAGVLRHVPDAPYSSTLANHSDSQSVSHTRINIERGCHEPFQAILDIYNRYVTAHCQLSFLYICYLQRKQLPTWPSPPRHWNSFISLHWRSVSLYNPHGMMGRLRKLASIQSELQRSRLDLLLHQAGLQRVWSHSDLYLVFIISFWFSV